MSVEIREVTSKKELKKFVSSISNYIKATRITCRLIEEEMVTLDKRRIPAFEVCDAIYF